MYHQITIVGNLGKNPKMRYTKNGIPVTNLSVATNRKWNNADGAKGEEVTWFRVTAWRGMAEAANQYLAKGSQVMVIGRLDPDENGNPRVWTDNNGNPRASYEITATTIKFLGKASPSPAPTAPTPTPSGVANDEIPF